MKRREFIGVSVAASIYLFTGCANDSDDNTEKIISDINETSSDSTVPQILLKNITDSSLNIPPLLDPQIVDGVKKFQLSIEERTHGFFEGIDTKTYGISADYLGPTLLIRQDENVSIEFTNRLNETTTIHGHGMHVPANMDGGPHQKMNSGDTWAAEYRVNQKACTNWYHPHLMGHTARQVYMGLAGIIIIEDDEINSLNLPNTYGIDDIPIVVQDRIFTSEGEIDYSPSSSEMMHGYIGDIYLTNGQIKPRFSANASLLRLRLLNGSNSSVYKFGFDDERAFFQVAGDNSLLEKPVELTSVKLSPGERAEIIVDLSQDQGKEILLQELSSTQDILTISVDSDIKTDAVIPDKLTTLENIDMSTSLRTRTFELSGSMGNLYINGVSMDMSVINETIPLNEVEIWEVKNSMGMAHNFHIHATHFRVLERRGSVDRVGENEKGYKDTVSLSPYESVKLLVKMTDYSDVNIPYMYHCHFLEHEDAGMMGQFVVV